MGTRCNIHFTDASGYVAANIYRHSDGYPEKVIPDLGKFFAAVETDVGSDGDTRFGDPSYLAAKFTVWQAARFTRRGPLDFTGVGIAMQDIGNARYIYEVRCADRSAHPEVTVTEPAAYATREG